MSKEQIKIEKPWIEVASDDKQIIRQEAIKNNFDGFKPYVQEIIRTTADKIRVKNGLPKKY